MGCRRVFDIKEPDLRVSGGSDDGAVGRMWHELYREDVLPVARRDLRVERKAVISIVDVDSGVVTAARKKGTVARPSKTKFVKKSPP